jgi:hypothetical protein
MNKLTLKEGLTGFRIPHNCILGINVARLLTDNSGLALFIVDYPMIDLPSRRVSNALRTARNLDLTSTGSMHRSRSCILRISLIVDPRIFFSSAPCLGRMKARAISVTTSLESMSDLADSIVKICSWIANCIMPGCQPISSFSVSRRLACSSFRRRYSSRLLWP